MKIIILAGGMGRRLWPVSNNSEPKQFIDFFGTGESLLQTACRRAASVVGETGVIVVTNEQFGETAHRQLPWLPAGHLLLEPVHRNTCPAAAWAVHRAMEESGDDDTVALMPADQLILHEERFAAALQQASTFVATHDTVLTMGATPTRTEPGYGYIQIEVPLTDGDAAAAGTVSGQIWNVKSFIEKPEREFAKMLIESGEFLWNTGIYVSRIGYLRQQFKTLLPYVLRDMDGTIEEEERFVRDNYSKYPNLSLDLAILERMPSRSVMHSDFGWADIGTWHGIYEAIPKDGNDNVVVNSRSRVTTDNSRNNIVSMRDGRLAVLSGLEGFIIAESDDVLLICPKGDSSALVRKYRLLNEEPS